MTRPTSRRPGPGPSTCGPAAPPRGRLGRAADRRGVPSRAGWTVPGAAQLELVACPARQQPSDCAGPARRPPFRGSPTACSAGPAPAAARAAAAVLAGAGGRPAASAPRRSTLPTSPPRSWSGSASARLTELLLRAPRRPAPTPRTRGRSRTPALPLPARRAPRPSTPAAGRGRATSRAAAPPRVVLVVEPLDGMLAQVWSARRAARRPGALAAASWSAGPPRRELPPSADYPALARLWADRVGPGRVHVLVAPTDAGRRPATSAGLARPVDPTPRRAVARPRWRDLSPAAAASCAGSTRCSTCGPRRRAAAVARPWPTRRPGPGPRSPSPSASQDWVAARARDLAGGLASGGYAVHGDLARAVRGSRSAAPAAAGRRAGRCWWTPASTGPPVASDRARRSSGERPVAKQVLPPRRHAEDRHVVPPGRAVPQPESAAEPRASSTPPTASTRTSWPPST